MSYIPSGSAAAAAKTIGVMARGTLVAGTFGGLDTVACVRVLVVRVVVVVNVCEVICGVCWWCLCGVYV